MSGDALSGSDKIDFFAHLAGVDNNEVLAGDTHFKVGTFVTVEKQGFDPEIVYVITKIFQDGTFELGSEKHVLPGLKFSSKELVKFGSDFDIYEAKNRFGRA